MAATNMVRRQHHRNRLG